MISIAAPYDRGEVTAAAVRLADLAVAVGEDVGFITASRRAGRVHPYWDSRVLVEGSAGCRRAVTASQHMVYFGTSLVEALCPESRSRGTRQTLVPLMHTLHPYDGPLTEGFDQVVCPSLGCARRMRSFLKNPDAVSWLHWDAGVAPVKRTGFLGKGIRVCFWLDGVAVDACGPLVLQVLGELLAAESGLHVTLVSAKSWARHDRDTLRRLSERYPARLVRRYRDDLVRQSCVFHEHDWVVMPSVRGDFGSDALAALGCGVPVVVLDVTPFAELVRHQVSGVVVPTEVRTNWLMAPTAVPSYARLFETCADVLFDGDQLASFQTAAWNRETETAMFESYWKHAWGYA